MTAQWICRRVTAGSLILLAIATARAQTATQSPAAIPAPATQPSPTTQPVATTAANSDLTSLSLEDLMNVQVTSVSKQPQKIADAPAAITVIGPDEIQRSGLSNIPELLRLVPGMDVERVNANRWAITSRGLNGTFADDLLVLMDGRSEYTPVFGGVRWASVDYPLEDLDRIEAIRGPGATLWGSNAVNGVVNIETKSARDTQGVLLDSQLSTDESEQTARYGGQIDPDTFYRVYEKASYTDSGVTPLNDPAHDEWSSYQSGFRIDRYSTPQDTLTLQGDGYYQNLLDTYTVLSLPEMLNDYQSGGNLEGRWTHTDSARSSSELQIYYERTDSDEFPAPSYEDTYDVSFQNRFPLGDRQEMTWGLGARDSEITFRDIFPGEYDPQHWSDYLYNGFVQDQITLAPDRLQWYLGTKLEDSRVGNFQVQPGTRLLFTPDDQNSFWTAVSRSVRIPSLYQEENLDLGGFEVNHRDLSPEQTISYEAGYKTQPAKSFTADITGFYNSYRDLINYTPLLTPTFIPYGVGYDNTLKGDTYGTEVSANWQATDEWRLSGSYSLLKAFVEPQNDTGENVPLVVRESVDGSAPQNQYQLHSYLDITKSLQFNTSVYYVDALPTLANPPLGAQNVPEHTRVDLNLQWEPRPNLSFMAGVQNLLQNRHSEFGNFNSSVMSEEIQRSYFVRCSWSF